MIAPLSCSRRDGLGDAARNTPSASPSDPTEHMQSSSGEIGIGETLIVPAHNERHRLHETLSTYGEDMSQRYGEDFEIIVDANGSDDGTVDIALQDRRVRPQIRVVDISEKIGMGGALQDLRRTLGRKVAFGDTDAATDPGLHSLSALERVVPPTSVCYILPVRLD